MVKKKKKNPEKAPKSESEELEEVTLEDIQKLSEELEAAPEEKKKEKEKKKSWADDVSWFGD